MPEPVIQTTFTESAQSGSGQALATAPAQGAVTGQPPANPAQPPQGKAGELAGQPTAPIVDAEKLFSMAGFTETPEQKAARLERDYSASSREAVRLSKREKQLRELLAQQNIELADGEDGMIAGLLPGKAFSKDAKAIEIAFDDLTDTQKELFANNPDKAIKLVLDRAMKSLVRPMPTVDSLVQTVTPERAEAAMKFVATSVTSDGKTPRFQNFQAYAPAIQREISNPGTPKAVKDFFNQAPEMYLEWRAMKYEQVYSEALALATKQNQAKQEKIEAGSQMPPMGPQGGGTPGIVSEQDAAAAGQAWAKRIAAAV